MSTELIKHVADDTHGNHFYLYDLASNPLKPDLSLVGDMHIAARESRRRTLFPIHAGLMLLGVTVGGLIGFIAQSEIGLGGLIGGIVALICNSIIIFVLKQEVIK